MPIRVDVKQCTGAEYVGEAILRSRPLRVAFVNTHPIQYFAPLYAHLTRQGIEVTALYLSDFSIRGGHDRGFGQAVQWDIDLLAGYRSEFTGKAAKRREIGGFFSMVAPQLWSAIRRGAFDAIVIHGHNLAAHHIALAAAKMSRTLVFARGETHLRLRRPAWREAARTPLLRKLYGLFDGFLAIGSANAKYYAAMGAPAESRHRRWRILELSRLDQSRIRVLPNTFRFPLRPRNPHPTVAPHLAFAGKPFILTVSRINKEDAYKGHRRALDIFAELRARHPDLHYVIAGDGSDRPTREAYAATAGVSDAVHFVGHVPTDLLSSLFAAASAFVMPSTKEGFGIVFLEAAAYGIPVIAGNKDGSADALADGAIGTLIDPDDPVALLEALSRAVAGESPPPDVNALSRFSPQHFQAHVDHLLASFELAGSREQPLADSEAA